MASRLNGRNSVDLERQGAPSTSEVCLRVEVLGGLRLTVAGFGVLHQLSPGSQRLLAFLAIHNRSFERPVVAGTLWPEATEEHAHASLRSAISRFTPMARTTIEVSSHDIRLSDEASVDLREAGALAHRLINAANVQDSDLGAGAIAALSLDLLPGWYDDWALIEAESWRQLRLHALDNLTERLLASGRIADARSAAIAAVAAEPLRETSHAALVSVYLAEGNDQGARAAFERYRTMLLEKLGLEPTARIQALISA